MLEVLQRVWGYICTQGTTQRKDVLGLAKIMQVKILRCADNWPVDNWPADNWPVDNWPVTFWRGRTIGR